VKVKRRAVQLARRYQTALRRFLSGGPEAGLAPAVLLGRKAVELGLETLDLALIHEQALGALVLQPDTPDTRKHILGRTGVFFAEAIVPLEETHRTAREAAVHLLHLNRSLKQRARELTTSNRRLKSEVTRREVVAENLRESERNTSRLLEKSKQLQEQLRGLSRRILSAQEEERKRISRELHDVIAQMLTGINVRLASLKLEASTNARGLARKIAQTQRMVERSVDIVHQFARELRPAVLDDLGLIPALHSHVRLFAKKTGLRVSLTAFAGVEALSGAKRTVLYRVAQEALGNVASHARAGRVDIGIQQLPDSVRMRIKDDGKSFDVEHVLHARKGRRLGLLGMRERVEMVGGTFAIDSAPGRGTLIEVHLPSRPPVKKKAAP
jgi:signal transduction histidine kinase